MTYKIYVIQFEDATQYVGLTKNNVKIRLANHKNKRGLNCSNRGVTERIRDGVAYSVMIVDRAATYKEAVAKEAEVIMDLKDNCDLLNVYINTGPDQQRIDSLGRYKLHCFLCQKFKHPTEFSTCKTTYRKCGRVSMCKICQSVYYTIIADYGAGIPLDVIKEICNGLNGPATIDPNFDINDHQIYCYLCERMMARRHFRPSKKNIFRGVRSYCYDCEWLDGKLQYHYGNSIPRSFKKEVVKGLI